MHETGSAPGHTLPFPVPMKKVVFINFGSARFTHRQMLQLLSAKLAGKADQVHGFLPKHLKKLGFYNTHPWAHPSQRGFAFWSWKPFIIHQALRQVQDGDMVIYSDVGRPWVRMFHHSLGSVQQWLEELRQDIMPGIYIPYTGTIENWTKAATLNQMEALSPDILNSPPIQTSFSVWRKTPATVRLAEEWEEKCRYLSLVGDYDANTDIPNGPSFKDHRHDQAIFSILCFQHHLKALDSIGGQRPEVDKDLDAWLQLQGAPPSGACADALLNGLSATARKLERAVRTCLKK